MNGPRTIFLTGATGFIGGRVAALLAARGDRVRCLVRDVARAQGLERRGAELVVGDTTDAAALASGLAGADAAIHLAAIYDVGVVDAAALERTNVGGTAAFLDATSAARTRRRLYISSTVALGPVAVGMGDEMTRNNGPFRSVYERTKTEAHLLARRAQESARSEAAGERAAAGAPTSSASPPAAAAPIIICPAYVYGPGDNGPGGRFLRDLVRRRVPGLLTNSSWFSFVHVDDVAAGIVAALDRGADGATYVLSGEDATVNDFALRAASVAGVKPPSLRFPASVARLTGSVLDVVTRAAGVRFPITRENVQTVAGLRWLHSHAKATAELGWHPRGLAAGLPETVAWSKAGDRAAT